MPDAGMMAPVEALVRFMTTLDERDVRQAFAGEGVMIVENFSPYLFQGRDAVQTWITGFREHAEGLSGLEHCFEPACDFSVSGSRAFFTLPTCWKGRTKGRPFEEKGGWAFVLERDGERWRIKAYGWAVTAFDLL